jgi:hypothetical protein
MLVAVVSVAILPSAHLLFVSTALSLFAGLLLLPAIAPIVPAYFLWFVPLLTCAGGLAMVLSVHSEPRDSVQP